MFNAARISCWLVAAEHGRPLIQRLDPGTRAKVLAALGALIILGFAMVLLAWMGARATRRYMHRYSPAEKRAGAPRPAEDDWAQKPLILNGKRQREDTGGE